MQLLNTTVNFVRREIKTRYAQSWLGSLWVVIYPLAFALITAAVFSFVFHGYVGQIPYFLYVIVGFDSWFWFSQTIVRATHSLIYNRDLIANNKFPTESIIFSLVFTGLIDYLINLITIYVLMLFFGQNITFNGFVLVLLVSGSQLFFQAGISLICASLNVYFRDLQNIIEILLQLLFYATPVIYSLTIVPSRLRNFILINPMAQTIISYRDALFGQYIPMTTLLLLWLIAGVTFVLGYGVYKKLEPKFAELI